MNYFAIHVKTGTEVTTAERLQRLNELSNGELFHSVFVPFESIIIFSSESKTKTERHRVLFNSYIFVKAGKLTKELYSIIKGCSQSIYKILMQPISVDEIEKYNDMNLVEYVIPNENQESNLDTIINKCNEIILNRRNSLNIVQSAKKTRLKLTQKDFICIASNIQLTVHELLYNPFKVLKEVLKYFEHSYAYQTKNT